MNLDKHFLKFKEKGSIYFSVKVFPNSSENKIKEIKRVDIEGRESEVFYINIKAPADKNKANQELINFLSALFDTAKGNVIIISGKTERLKLLKIIK